MSATLSRPLSALLLTVGLLAAGAVAVPAQELPKTKGIAHYVVFQKPPEGIDVMEFDTFQFPKLGLVTKEAPLVIDSVRNARMNIAAIQSSEVRSKSRQQYGQPAITIVLNDENTQKLQEFSRKFKGQQILIAVDGIPVSAPVLLSPINEGIVTISGGNRTPEQMKEVLDMVLEYKEPPTKPAKE